VCANLNFGAVNFTLRARRFGWILQGQGEQKDVLAAGLHFTKSGKRS
jgi:hypothetical protein